VRPSVLELNPFLYGRPLQPENCISREDECTLLLRLAASGQNARLSAPRRYGKTTLIEEVRAAAEQHGLNTVRVDLYGVGSRAEVALRLEDAYRALRGPMARAVGGLLRRTKVKASAGPPGVKLEAESAAADDGADRALLELLDLPLRFYKRTAARTLVIYDEFQDVLAAGGGIDALIRSRIQHHDPAASYIFAGSHPGMMAELFGQKSRPLYDQARAVPLRPLPDLAVAQYIEDRFVGSSRSASGVIDDLVGLARGHPQRAMFLAHHLWEHTPHGEPADFGQWERALAEAYDELQDSYERLWDSHVTDVDRAVIAAVAWGEHPLTSETTLRRFGLEDRSMRLARDRLLASGDLQRTRGDDVELVDPLYSAWVAADRRPPRPRRAITSLPVNLDTYPFGTPDASRAALSVLADDVFGGAVDHSVRIVVGRNGAGRTFALRRMQLDAENNESVWSGGLASGAPETSAILGVAASVDPGEVVETWTRIWRAAILRAVANNLVSFRQLRGGLRSDDVSALSTDFSGLYPDPSRPRSIWSEFGAVVSEHGHGNGLKRYLAMPDWPDLRALIASALRDAPPLYYFLDGIDENFQAAPQAWLQCQQGLFLAVMQLLRDSDFGSRLHVVAAVRDQAYLSLLSSEHAGRYRGEPHIRVLRWESADALRLLHARLQRLDERSLMRPDLGPTPEGWLGVHTVTDARGGREAAVGEYLLRHTRSLPRDIVALGNSLASEVATAKADGRDALDQGTLRATVIRAARRFGSEELAACANAFVGQIGRTVGFQYSPELVADVVSGLRESLSGIGDDVVSGRELEGLAEHLVDHFSDQKMDKVQALNLLWQHGILGYTNTESELRDLRYGRSETEFWLPLNAAGYGLHPVVASAVARGDDGGRA